ncbi:beta-1,4-N-acetylgalactosaminyltransferase bre-4 [Lingula anatina]|uniref:Beta-1,4-galactosyltransferase n=1 Tax=Lingula anatina TaxID=7574 RepID=A0A1S3JH52_LINAN|nr:beta-1,4-N-acetylgalactosaminyltransferase bre-4 [Lingula anatina]|eukprot:XP_013409688.1 beta-1,4-N-acetylgalactosaminyltransferase bre-4 [Lingula anatina]
MCSAGVSADVPATQVKMTTKCSWTCLMDRSHLKWLLLVVVTLLLIQYIGNLLVYKNFYNVTQYFNGVYWLGQAVSGSLYGVHQKKMAHILKVNGTLTTLGTNTTNSNTTVSMDLQTTMLVQPNVTVTVDTSTSSGKDGNLCPSTPPGLKGRIVPDTTAATWETLQAKYSTVEPGGRWRPKDCTSRHHVYIVIPYRDRDEHLRILLNNLHPFLQKQQLDYGIYVVEQAEGSHFNRGMLMNIGFIEGLRVSNYSCVIFHDVDLLPENDNNFYSCPQQPRHMSVAIDKFNYRLPYASLFGGITALRVEQMKNVNGYPNVYFGWGGEDDDFSDRVRSKGYQITRYPAEVSRYKMIKHNKDKSNPPNPVRFSLVRTAKSRFKVDGLQNIQYELVKKEERPLYTWLNVKIDEKKVLQTSYMNQFKTNPWLRNILKS